MPDLYIKLSTDPWVTSSLLQKAIRRSDSLMAIRAAIRFNELRGAAVWHRLVTIAFEDIGLGAPDLVSEVALLASDRRIRSVIADEPTLLAQTVQKMSVAPKDRSADYLYCAATKLSDSQTARMAIQRLGVNEQIEIAADPAQPLKRRAVAALVCGTVDGRGEKLSKGSTIKALIEAFQDSTPSLLADAVALAARKAHHPFVLLLLPLWSAYSPSQDESWVTDEAIPGAVHCNGVPLYAFDKHTFGGKRAIERFAFQSEPVRRILASFVLDHYRADVAMIAAFYADAMPVSRKLNWRLSQRLEGIGLEADMTDAGCSIEGIRPIVECFRANLDQLNEIRRMTVAGQK